MYVHIDISKDASESKMFLNRIIKPRIRLLSYSTVAVKQLEIWFIEQGVFELVEEF